MTKIVEQSNHMVKGLMQGQLEISSTLAREAGVDELAEQREPFLEVLHTTNPNYYIGGFGRGVLRI